MLPFGNVVLAALVAGPLFAAAGQSHAPEAPGHFVARPAVSIDSIRRYCLSLGDDTYDRGVHEVGACALGAIGSFGAAGGRRWYATTVGRRWLLAEPATATADTAAESELVVLTASASQRRDTLLTPVWHYRFEPEMLRSVTPEVVGLKDGGVLLAIDECVNGTGGCSQTFFVERARRWHVVRLAFLDSLNRRYPGAIQHGFHVDVRTLRATAAVYGPSDGNCCPSRIADMRLRLGDKSLEIVELRVRPAN